MKAWVVRDKCEFSATVVFAETMGKARSLAMHTDACEDVDFLDIEVRRVPHMDKYYSDGKKEMDWYSAKDRIALVKECGFQCHSEAFDIDDCEVCPAKEYCGKYEAEKEALEDMWRSENDRT